MLKVARYSFLKNKNLPFDAYFCKITTLRKQGITFYVKQHYIEKKAHNCRFLGNNW